MSSHVRNKRWPVECPIDGCKGQKGARGIAGPVGPQGYSGVRGPPGHCDPNVIMSDILSVSYNRLFLLVLFSLH